MVLMFQGLVSIWTVILLRVLFSSNLLLLVLGTIGPGGSSPLHYIVILDPNISVE